MKYDKLRSLLGNGGLRWTVDTITCAVVSGYTFNASHANLTDIQAAGGTILATSRLTQKAVTSTGVVQSAAVTLKVVPAGGPYDIILFVDTTGQSTGLFPLVNYPDVVTTSFSGDVIVRPDGSLVSGTGDWFQL